MKPVEPTISSNEIQIIIQKIIINVGQRTRTKETQILTIITNEVATNELLKTMRKKREELEVANAVGGDGTIEMMKEKQIQTDGGIQETLTTATKTTRSLPTIQTK